MPVELVLVKGPTRKLKDDFHRLLWSVRESNVEVLVLAKAGDGSKNYRRVGLGALANWDDACETVEVLTLI